MNTRHFPTNPPWPPYDAIPRPRAGAPFFQVAGFHHACAEWPRALKTHRVSFSSEPIVRHGVLERAYRFGLCQDYFFFDREPLLFKTGKFVIELRKPHGLVRRIIGRILKKEGEQHAFFLVDGRHPRLEPFL